MADRADCEHLYCLLARLLAPLPDGAAKRQWLRQYLAAVDDAAHRWDPILDAACHHGCASLLFARLQVEDLLDLLPEEPRRILRRHFRHNLARTMLFRAELVKLLQDLGQDRIQVILLKGVATWLDDLYGAEGAREMSDIDILVSAGDIERAAAIVEDHGYEQISNPHMIMEELPTDRRHHHLQTYRKPGSPVLVELHYRLGYAGVGGIASEEELARNSLPAALDGLEVRYLNPTYRLIHNAAHAMVPECEFISSRVPLRQLAEFVFLATRYRREIDWSTWFAKGVGAGMTTEFLTCLALASDLFGLDYPRDVPVSRRARLHAGRIRLADRLATGRNGFKDHLAWLMIRSYYYLKLPGWVFRNVCYTEEGGHVMARLLYMLKKAASPRSRAKIG